MPNQLKMIKYIIGAIGVLLLFMVGSRLLQKQENIISYNEFITLAEQGDIEEVILGENRNYLQVRMSDSASVYLVANPQSDNLFDYLMSHNIQIIYESAAAGSFTAQTILIIASLGALIIYYRKKTGESLINNANKKSDALSLMLDDVAGNAEAKAMVEDIIQFIKNPDKYASIGARMPRGILFYGPPGTGKTLMAKAIAGEAGVPFYAMSGSDFMQTYVGVGASRVRELFQTAKKAEKAVIFIDEIDAIGKKRSRQPGASHDERDQTLNALLTEMSGFHERDGVVVIAATNRLDTLDDALTRPGRFDRLVEIGLPDRNARLKILELHAQVKQLSPEINLTELAKSTVSFSGAMLENLLNEAAIFAANDNRSVIEPSHIDKAFFTVIAGAEKTDTSFITERDRKTTAYHEAGHALLTRLLLPDSTISKVTIIPSTRGAGGFSLSIPEDSLYLSKRKMLANIKVLLAGRASEELIFGADEITTGAGNDIEKASGHIVDYMNTYGMDESYGIFNMQTFPNHSDTELANLCREKLNQLYEEAKTILTGNLSSLHAVASALLERETINGEDIADICGNI